jgi:hypothetical protein
VSAAVSGWFERSTAIELKNIELRLGQKAADLGKAASAYSVLESKLADLEIALERYVALLKAAKSNPGDRLLTGEARLAWGSVGDRLAEIYQAVRAAGIDPNLQGVVEKVLGPVALQLQQSQQHPERDNGIVEQFERSLRGELRTCRSTVRQKTESLAGSQ